MIKTLSYQLTAEDMQETAGGLVNRVLQKKLKVTGHEVSPAKFVPGGITVEGRPVTVRDRMQPGETLVIRLPDAPGEMLLPGDGELTILYEDQDVLVVDKPAGRPSHPSHGHYRDSVLNDAAALFAARGEDVFPRLVGRLDLETSGVLMIAKHRVTAARLTKQRQTGEMTRTYLALVEGEMEGAAEASHWHLIDRSMAPGEPLRIPGRQDALGRDSFHSRMQVDPGGVPARTYYRVLEVRDGRSLVECRLETGRTHQIRVHMASLGHPLVGDGLYGTPGVGTADAGISGAGAIDAGTGPGTGHGPGRALLHAVHLTWRQPYTGERLEVSAPLPADLEAFR